MKPDIFVYGVQKITCDVSVKILRLRIYWKTVNCVQWGWFILLLNGRWHLPLGLEHRMLVYHTYTTYTHSPERPKTLKNKPIT